MSKKDNAADTRNQLQAAIKVLKVKAESGIADSDITPLRSAISNAKAVSFSGLMLIVHDKFDLSRF